MRWSGLLLLLASCDGQVDPPVSTAPELPPFALWQRIVSAGPLLGSTGAVGPEVQEELVGLCTLVSSDPAMLELAREDIARMPDAGRGLFDIARDSEEADAVRAAAIDLQPLAGWLLDLAKSDRVPSWTRARAAWRLSEIGPDLFVPEYLLRLRYERDHDTVVWIAAALARHGNLAGVDGLIAIAGNQASAGAASAQHVLAGLRERYGVDSNAALWRTWRVPPEQRAAPLPERSSKYVAVTKWRVRDLADFQLRGVDDGRFVLSRMDGDTALVLADALHDENPYTRVHAAQCLQRMGARGRAAGPELVLALAEPLLAPHAAKAIGQVGFAEGEPVLVAHLVPAVPLELRLACARALGFLGEPSALDALSALFDDPDPELAQATTESVVRLDADARDAARRLVGYLDDAELEPATSERALRAWLYERGADEEVAAWDAWRGAGVVETVEEAQARRDARARLVVGYLGG